MIISTYNGNIYTGGLYERQMSLSILMTNNHCRILHRASASNVVYYNIIHIIIMTYNLELSTVTFQILYGLII